MATFEFDVITEDGTATIYCDAVAEFTKAINVTVVNVGVKTFH